MMEENSKNKKLGALRKALSLYSSRLGLEFRQGAGGSDGRGKDCCLRAWVLMQVNAGTFIGRLKCSVYMHLMTHVLCRGAAAGYDPGAGKPARAAIHGRCADTARQHVPRFVGQSYCSTGMEMLMSCMQWGLADVRPVQLRDWAPVLCHSNSCANPS